MSFRKCGLSSRDSSKTMKTRKKSRTFVRIATILQLLPRRACDCKKVSRVGVGSPLRLRPVPFGSVVLYPARCARPPLAVGARLPPFWCGGCPAVGGCCEPSAPVRRAPAAVCRRAVAANRRSRSVAPALNALPPAASRLRCPCAPALLLGQGRCARRAAEAARRSTPPLRRG